jgi:hypothetical protein
MRLGALEGVLSASCLQPRINTNSVLSSQLFRQVSHDRRRISRGRRESEAVWAIVADPRRLPGWLPTVVAAHVTAEDDGRNASVELEGESHGHCYSLTSQWSKDEGVHELEWGDGSRGYWGTLRV